MHFSLGQVPISRSPQFFSCGCSKPFGTPWFGVLSLRIEKWALECSCVPKGVGATFCSKAGPFFSCGCSKASRVPVCPRLPKPHSAAKQGRSFRVAALNWILSLRIENGPSSARVCPKGSGPHSSAKQGRSFRVAALKLPGSLCAQGGPSHILQQNRVVLFVWLLQTLLRPL